MKPKGLLLILIMELSTLLPPTVYARSLLFYEPFEGLSTIQDNGGKPGTNGWPDFSSGITGKAADFSRSKIVCYPLSGNLSLNNGTIEFWIKPPDANHLGFFDIGNLGRVNSWGIFKNSNHVIMEVKNQRNSFDQAWIPRSMAFDDGWHLVTAVWEQAGADTLFKVCLDGKCKSNYDGKTGNSFPSMSGEFCVGWSGWYGYSESAMDELRILDYAKSDAEIRDGFTSPGKDMTRPVIMLNGGHTATVNIGSGYSDPGATAVDDRDGDITENIVSNGLVDTSRVGAYRISHNVLDAAGNPAKEAIRTVYVLDPSIDPVQRAFEYLAERMDQFNTRFNVYSDFVAGGNHGTPSGWMGDYDILMVDSSWDANCYRGLSCFKNIWETNEPGWVGIRWLQPENNWGTIPNAGYDLSGATNLSFYARGAVGNEPVEFVAGGVPGDNPDSIQPTASSGTVVLSTDWELFEIDLTGLDLSNVISPFGWTVRNDPVFFIDEVQYNLSRPNSLRLIQSFEIQDLDTEIALANVAYIYDNALALSAFLARGDADDLRRAKILADTLVFVLENDRAYTNGQIRNGYTSGDISDPVPGTAKLPGWWDRASQNWFEDEFNVSTHTGNVAWAMLALLSYYESQGGEKYLQAAEEMGDWVAEETWDDRGGGGFTGGFEGWEVTANNTTPPRKLLYKATEHNIDLYPAFLRLYALTHKIKWLERAEHAKVFVDSMWNPSTGHFWTGTTENGEGTDKFNIPVDIQAWAVMAMPGEIRYRSALDWAYNNCVAESDGFKGFDFNCQDGDGVWFEGTAQMALGFDIDNQGAKSEDNLAELRKAQTDAQNANGGAIVAASHDGVTTGFEWEYFARRHVGATSWYLLAEQRYNPYWGAKTPAVPVIKANGRPQTVTINSKDSVSLTVDLIATTGLGTTADWWVAASTPSGEWYYYRHPSQWISAGTDWRAISPAYQGPMAELHNIELLNITGLPLGLYTVYFGMDSIADGFLNLGALYVDQVEINIIQ